MVYRLSEVNLRAHVGQVVQVEAVLVSAELRPMKAEGKKYANITIQDRTESNFATKFNVSDDYLEKCGLTVGQPYIFTLQTNLYDGGKDGVGCVMQSFEASNTPVGDFVAYENNYENSVKYIVESVQSISNSQLGKVAGAVLNANWGQFSVLPAATSMHHIYLGGLAVHTAGVLKTCLTLAKQYQEEDSRYAFNVPLLIAGASLHDIGKCCEYKLDPAGIKAVYSPLGILAPHITAGLSMIMYEAGRLGLSMDSNIYELTHLISSHHGRLEWGSPVEPHTLEADLLSLADMMDSTLNRRNLLNVGVVAGDGMSRRLGAQNFSTYLSVPDPSVQLKL